MSDMKVNNMSFAVGQTMIIYGVPVPNDHQCKINICTPEDDIALHIHPRFGISKADSWVIYNTRRGGQWGEELKQEGIPCPQGEKFKVVIQFTADSFLVTLTVDGSCGPGGSMSTPTFKFPNRLGANKYNFHTFEKGVCVKSIEIK